ncbi:D-glycero-alpha-D-manno-heptose-1,7-bisphosphate 7-phosphatase [Alteromonas sp. ASW11-130]|uniref:D-glycero-alpha-D-manno-heptose-1,7-bisphosphate 7-phosphatase n=1 Tax=Alteromonas sp. ASW11-130 TaxID=3015775 RepID=UPI0022418FED|nr:HAD family hydrolase [Alteromonas sp. ASW11-130]MCW8092220.1 HAD family hydrolase [Alteromonas sp. ASW11-130]
MLNKALFLDRDGIVNVDKGYVGKIADFEFVNGIFQLIKGFRRLGFLPIIVTNQSGIGRGYFSEEAFAHLCDWMNKRFEENDIAPVPVYFCPHHPTEAIAEYLVDCGCRKPQPGLLFQAAEDFSIDLSQSVMIGDSLRDLEAAASAGIPFRLWVTENKQSQIASSCTHCFTSLSEIEPLTLVA